MQGLHFPQAIQVGVEFPATPGVEDHLEEFDTLGERLRLGEIGHV